MKKSGVMAYKRFTLKIIALQLLLAITITAFVYTLFQSRMTITSINLGILVISEVIFLIHTLNKTNRDLARFFEAFEFHDTTVSFESMEKSSYSPLRQSLNKMLGEFRELRAGIENDRFFYLNTLNHTGTGLLVTESSGKVRFSNRAMQKILDLTTIGETSQLNRLQQGLAERVMRMTPNSKELIKVVSNSEVIQLSLRCSMFTLSEETYRIISFQDIKFEIEQNETEAWQKLIRILTHEIMNSVSPITLTSAGIIRLLEEELQKQMKDRDETLLNKIQEGLHAIRKRSKGLAAFVESYQSVYHLPLPVFTVISVKDLFTQVESLMKETLVNKQICLEINVLPDSLLLHADEKLICQTLINLLQNSVNALEQQTDKWILLKAFQVNDQVRITVSDNGKGIPPALLDSVFIPFFTTREKGSGIGLSLSREIMKLHSGGIRVHSEPGKETTFTLIF
ncbi:MAG: GHKL domain-containing protein [Bacteroidales bacterium]|nr:GHKL domain-containing protein [Bacteroidales bacterium]